MNETDKAVKTLVEKIARDGAASIYETFWTDISSRKAWMLATIEGKRPPYAGYLIQLDKGQLRCVRDDMGTRFQFKPSA